MAPLEQGREGLAAALLRPYTLQYSVRFFLLLPDRHVGDVGHVQVHANELVFASDKPGRSTGDITFSVESPLDKGRVFASLLDGIGIGEGGGTSQQRTVTCFIGDSVTDLIPLLIARFWDRCWRQCFPEGCLAGIWGESCAPGVRLIGACCWYLQRPSAFQSTGGCEVHAWPVQGRSVYFGVVAGD